MGAAGSAPEGPVASSYGAISARASASDADVEQPRSLPQHAVRLIVMRHGKSSWKVPGELTDEMRPLKKRGRREARIAGEFLESRGWRPQVVVCSTALRSRQTWNEMKRAFGAMQPLVFYAPELYAGGLSEIKAALVRHVAPGQSTALVIGHNPGVEALVGHLCGSGVPMKTAQAACFVYDAEGDEDGGWAGALARDATWDLVDFCRPRSEEKEKKGDDALDSDDSGGL
eukprot:tig00000269_g23770.t1